MEVTVEQLDRLFAIDGEADAGKASSAIGFYRGGDVVAEPGAFIGKDQWWRNLVAGDEADSALYGIVIEIILGVDHDDRRLRVRLYREDERSDVQRRIMRRLRLHKFCRHAGIADAFG